MGRRIAALLIPLALILIGLFWPLVLTGAGQSGSVSDPVWFSHYKADYDVKADGRVEVVETITAQFPGGKHGIFEFWDVAAPHDPRVRMVPTVTSVKLDGAPTPYQMLWDKSRRFLTAKIGDPSRYLDPGTHEFEIRSVVPNALAPSRVGKDLVFASTTGDVNSTPSVFYWFLVKSWNNRIDRADISVRLPARVAGVQCSIGFGKGYPCPDMAVGGDGIEITLYTLAPRTPVTMRAGVDIATPPRDEMPWSWRFDRILGTSVAKVIGLLAASVAAGLLGYAWWRTTVESSPGFPLQYAPPDGLGPVQCEYIRTEAVPRNGLTATLFYLAERRLVELNQRGEKHWTVKGLADNNAWRSVDPVSRDVAWALKVNEPGAVFEATKTVASGKRLSKAKTDMTGAVKKWATKNSLVVPKRSEQWVRVANLLSVVLAVCGFITWGFTITLWGLPFAVFFVATMRSWAEGVGSRRTPAGRE